MDEPQVSAVVEESSSTKWVVLATVSIEAAAADGSPGKLTVSFVDRRVLLSTERLQAVAVLKF